MHLVSTYLPPSAASHALKCNLGQELLVVAKINRLDALELLPTGARLLNSLELLARIVAVHEIARHDGPGALLVVTDHPDCSVLIVEFSTKENGLIVKSSQSFTSAYARPLAGCHPCAVSADGRQAAVALHQGMIHILAFSRRAGSVYISSKFECPTREILVSGFSFVPFSKDEDDKLALAFLLRTYTGDRQLIIRDVDTEENEISSNAVKIDVQDEGIDRVIPILPSQDGGGGGLLLFGGQEILFFDSKQEVKSPTKNRKMSTSDQRKPDVHIDWPCSEITGYGFIDGNRLLLGDKFGKLMLLTLIRTGESKRVHKMSLHKFGESSAASCIAYLNAGVIFLGSETGDSHLIQLNPTGDISVFDTFQNVAPVTAAVLADLDNSDEPAVVTCSGGGRTGSLRIIRTGANIEQLAPLSGVDGVQDVFTLCGIDGYHSYLLLSFPNESKLIALVNASQFTEIPATDFPGVMRSETTLAAANIKGDRDEASTLAVQVTTTAVLLFDVQSGMEYTRWRGAITTADISGDSICVALKKGQVVKLRVNTDDAKLDVTAECQFDSEVSTLSIQPISSQERKPRFAFFGLWEDNSVRICHFDALDSAGCTKIQLPHIPRSIMAWSFSASNDQVHLLIGTGHGQLVSLKLNYTKVLSIDMSSRRSVSLGDRPVYLQRCAVDGKIVVLATGGRTIIMSWSNGRIAQHHVNVKGLETVAVLNSSAYRNALVFKLTHGLTIARIGKLEKLKIDTIPLGYDVPVAIAYHPDVKAFAVGCVRTEPSRGNDPDVVTSSFKLLDALTLEHLNSHTLGSNEEVTKISVLDLSIGGSVEKFIVVGTAIWDDDGNEPSKGRILLFRAQMGRARPAVANPAIPTLVLAMDAEIPGSVVALGEVGGYLAVLVNTVLIVYRVRRNENTKDMDLQPLDQWAHNYALWNLVVNSPERVVVGDSLQSITVLKWNEVKRKLEVVARDWTSLASMSVTIDDDYVIQSDIDGNLHSYQVDTSLERRGHYFFGENISHLMPGSLNAIEGIDTSLPIPKHLLFTPGGRISIISKCPESKALLLHNIQRNLSAALKRDWFDVLAWRAPHSSTKRLPTAADDTPQTFGFVDGDLLARLLEIEHDGLIKRVLEGSNSAERLGLEWRDIRTLVEEIQSMR